MVTDAPVSYNVAETKDVLIALNLVSLVILKHVRDGVQLEKDFSGIIGDILASDEVKVALSKAVSNASMIMNELKDLQISEGIELAMLQASFIPKLLEALKAPPTPGVK